MPEELPIIIREVSAGDEAFIYKSWLESYQENSYFSRQIPSSVFFNNHKKIIARLLKQHVLVACSEEDPDQIFGFIVYSARKNLCVVHYLYVKFSYRLFGIGTKLYSEALILSDHDPKILVPITHVTDAYKFLREKWRISYNPYLMGAPFETCQSSKASELDKNL